MRLGLTDYVGTGETDAVSNESMDAMKRLLTGDINLLQTCIQFHLINDWGLYAFL